MKIVIKHTLKESLNFKHNVTTTFVATRAILPSFVYYEQNIKKGTMTLPFPEQLKFTYIIGYTTFFGNCVLSKNGDIHEYVRDYTHEIEENGLNKLE